MSSPFSQSTYQVRTEWGVAGLARLAPTDIVVVVDVLRFSSVVSARVATGEELRLHELAERSLNGAAVASAAQASGAIVLIGALRNASAIANEILRVQAERGARTSVAIIAAGELTSQDASAGLRFSVEDQLGAGAIIDALGARGVDHTSPEAAAAGEAFRALKQAVRHLIGASGSGRELADRDERQVSADAAQLDVDEVAPRLRDGIITASAT